MSTFLASGDVRHYPICQIFTPPVRHQPGLVLGLYSSQLSTCYAFILINGFGDYLTAIKHSSQLVCLLEKRFFRFHLWFIFENNVKQARFFEKCLFGWPIMSLIKTKTKIKDENVRRQAQQSGFSILYMYLQYLTHYIPFTVNS